MKRINKKFIIFILILFISIGFAYLSATLNIAGLIGYKGNSWNIYFDNVQMIKNDVSADKPIINNSKDSVDFNISFSEPSEIYRFSVDVVNDGTIDAMIGEFIKTGVDSTNEDYIDYSVKYSNGEEVNVNDLLMHNTKVRLIVNVEYKYTTERLAPENTGNYSLTLKYVQANDNARKVEELIESGNSNTFVLNNAKANTLSNLKIYGNTSQTQYSGNNLYNVNDVCSDANCVSNGVIANSEGWITFNYDNSSGDSVKYSNYFVNNLDLVIGDTYTVVMEVKSVSGTGKMYPHSTYLEYGQLSSSPNYSFDSLTPGDVFISTSTARTSSGHGLRSFARFAAGDSGSITVRLSLIKGTGITKDNFVYEPYVGGIPSPNPNYPQDIHSVTNETQIYISSIKNIFNTNNIRENYQLAGGYGKEGEREGWFVSDFLPIKPQTEYQMFGKSGQYNCFYKNDKTFISCNQLSTGVITTPENAYYMKINDSLTNLYKIFIFEENSILNSSVENIYTSNNALLNYELLSGVTSPKNNWFVSDFIKVEGLTSYYILNKTTGTQNAFYDSNYNYISTTNKTTGFVESPEGAKYMRINGLIDEMNDIKIIPVLFKKKINLGSLELNRTGDDRDYIYNKDGDWYIKQKNNSIVYDGDSTIYNYSDNEGLFSVPLDIDNYSTTYYSTHALPATASWASTTIGSYTFDNTFRIRMPSSLATDKTTFKTWLTTNNIKVVSKKITDEDIKITDTNLIDQLNNLLNNNLFEGTNYITVIGSDLAPTIEFDYEK